MKKAIIESFNFPTKIQSGPGALVFVSEHLKFNNLSHPLVVTDTVLRGLKPMELLEKTLRDSQINYSVFSDFSGNPLESHVKAGVQMYKKENCDCIVTIGGGAAMDVAKSIAVLINNIGTLFEFEDIPGARPITEPLPPIIAIPTTAGTGSEVGRSAVISDDKTHAKKIIFTPMMMPELAILDAKLTVGLPPQVTATTGMDALTHLMEAYLAKGYQPMCEGIALQGLRMVKRSLKPAYRFAKEKAKGTNDHLRCRQEMLEASMMGAVAFQKGLGVTHSCAHALSTVCDLHHGLANGILLPYTMKFNSKGEGRRFKEIALALGLKSTKSKDVVAWIESLKKSLKIPKSLSEAGVKKSMIDDLVSVAVEDVCHSLNPRKVTKSDFHKLFKQAL